MLIERYSRLAEATERLLKQHKLSLRAAEAHTGVSYNVILNMREGKRPGYEYVLRFAKGMQQDPLHWLELAGYEDIVALVAPSPADQESTSLSEIFSPALSAEVAVLPAEGQRAYAVAVRAFTTAWVAGWQAMEEERSSGERGR